MIISPKEGEKVLFTIRKNLFLLTKKFFYFLLLFLLGLGLFLFFKNEYVTLASIVVLLFALSYGFYHFIIWYYDVYIITNKRVILAQQNSLFSKEFSEIDYSQIREVTYAIKGVFATIFHFGEVVIKSGDQSFILSGLSYPDEVQEMIKKISEKNRDAKDFSNISATELIDLIMKNHKK